MSEPTAEPWLPVPPPEDPRDLPLWCARCGEDTDDEGFCSYCGAVTARARRD